VSFVNSDSDEWHATDASWIPALTQTWAGDNMLARNNPRRHIAGRWAGLGIRHWSWVIDSWAIILSGIRWRQRPICANTEYRLKKQPQFSATHWRWTCQTRTIPLMKNGLCFSVRPTDYAFWLLHTQREEHERDW